MLFCCNHFDNNSQNFHRTVTIVTTTVFTVYIFSFILNYVNWRIETTSLYISIVEYHRSCFFNRAAMLGMSILLPLSLSLPLLMILSSHFKTRHFQYAYKRQNSSRVFLRLCLYYNYKYVSILQVYIDSFYNFFNNNYLFVHTYTYT